MKTEMKTEMENLFYEIDWPPAQHLFIERVNKMEVSEVSTHYLKWIRLGGVVRKERFKRIIPLIQVDVELVLKPHTNIGAILMDDNGQKYLVVYSSPIEEICMVRNLDNWVVKYSLPKSSLTVIAQARFEK